MAASQARRQRRRRQSTTAPPDQFDILAEKIHSSLRRYALESMGNNNASVVNAIHSLSNPQRARRDRKTITELHALVAANEDKCKTVAQIAKDPQLYTRIAELAASPLSELAFNLRRLEVFNIATIRRVKDDLRALAETHRVWFCEAGTPLPDDLPVRHPFTTMDCLVVRFNNVIVLRRDCLLPFRDDGAMDCGNIYIFFPITRAYAPRAVIETDVVRQCDRRFSLAVTPDSTVESYYSPTHPHINIHGEICLGEAYTCVDHLMRGRLFECVMVVDTMLRTSTTGGHYFQISDTKLAAAYGMLHRVGYTIKRCHNCKLCFRPMSSLTKGLLPEMKTAIATLHQRWNEWYPSAAPSEPEIEQILRSYMGDARAAVSEEGHYYCFSCAHACFCTLHKKYRLFHHLVWSSDGSHRRCRTSDPCVVTDPPSTTETPSASDETRQRLAEAARNRRRNPDGTFAPEGTEEGDTAPDQPQVDSPTDPPSE